MMARSKANLTWIENFENMKKIALIFSYMLLFVPGVFAQEVAAAENTFWKDPFNHPLFPLYALGLLILVVIVLVAVVAFYLVSILNMLIEKAAREKAEKAGVPYVPEPTWWQGVQQKLTRSTPVEKEGDILLDHNYDGIKELDNHLPPWWKWLFYATIVWSAVYLIVYHITDSLPLSAEQYEAEVAKFEKLKTSQPVATVDESTLEFVDDAGMISHGQKVFSTNCASCHRADAGGDNGPNLTDEYWLYGGDAKHIYATIKNGKPENGMISWGGILKPEEIRDAAFYIISIRGSNPPSPKAPQGELFVPEKKEIRPDSANTAQDSVGVVIEASL